MNSAFTAKMYPFSKLLMNMPPPAIKKYLIKKVSFSKYKHTAMRQLGLNCLTLQNSYNLNKTPKRDKHATTGLLNKDQQKSTVN